jgi:putative ATP-dependent endonuclease of the OLD family
VRKLTLPENDADASQYVRLAVRAYPELYFARFVILAEGDSERIVIPCVAEALGAHLDPSFVPIVPLGGRYVRYSWKLLSDLQIPHATLLDLDLGRSHGGANMIGQSVTNLQEIENDFSDNFSVDIGLIDLDELETLTDESFINGREGNRWLEALQDEGLYFPYPIDLDFSMLRAFPAAYQHPNPGGLGPRGGEDAVREKKLVTLKTGGNPNLFDEAFDEASQWYPYLFLSRSKAARLHLMRDPARESFTFLLTRIELPDRCNVAVNVQPATRFGKFDVGIDLAGDHMLDAHKLRMSPPV